MSLDKEIDDGSRPDGRIRLMLARCRRWMHGHPVLRLSYVALIAMLGSAIVVAGLILVPLPGPGWLIVFIGLGILGTEFHWARRLTGYTQRKLLSVLAWWKNRRAARFRAQ